MSDLIDRHLIADLVDAHGNVHWEDIVKLPSAEPERKKGEWIEYNYPSSECVYCDQCKEKYYPNDLLLGGNDYPNYCPNCGADMRHGGCENEI